MATILQLERAPANSGAHTRQGIRLTPEDREEMRRNYIRTHSPLVPRDKSGLRSSTWVLEQYWVQVSEDCVRKPNPHQSVKSFFLEWGDLVDVLLPEPTPVSIPVIIDTEEPAKPAKTAERTLPWHLPKDLKPTDIVRKYTEELVLCRLVIEAEVDFKASLAVRDFVLQRTTLTTLSRPNFEEQPWLVDDVQQDAPWAHESRPIVNIPDIIDGKRISAGTDISPWVHSQKQNQTDPNYEANREVWGGFQRNIKRAPGRGHEHFMGNLPGDHDSATDRIGEKPSYLGEVPFTDANISNSDYAYAYRRESLESSAYIGKPSNFTHTSNSDWYDDLQFIFQYVGQRGIYPQPTLGVSEFYRRLQQAWIYCKAPKKRSTDTLPSHVPEALVVEPLTCKCEHGVYKPDPGPCRCPSVRTGDLSAYWSDKEDGEPRFHEYPQYPMDCETRFCALKPVAPVPLDEIKARYDDVGVPYQKDVGGVVFRPTAGSTSTWGTKGYTNNTGFNVEKISPIDYADTRQAHLDLMKDEIQYMTPNEALPYLRKHDGYDAHYFLCIQGGVSFAEYASQHGLDQAFIKYAQRRAEIIRSKIEHRCPDGSCPEHRCAEGDDVNQRMTHYLNKVNPASATTLFRDGGYCVLYELGNKVHFKTLDALDDNQADGAFLALYDRTLKDALRKSADEPGTRKRIDGAFRGAEIHYIQPDPNYVRGSGDGHGRTWTGEDVICW